MMNTSDYLLLEEVARTARTSVNTVRHWLATGRLESVRPGRRRLVRRADLEEFLTAGGHKKPGAMKQTTAG